MSANKICLNMIVKDESAIIENCLRSVAPFLDYYVICDTGSTDDTKEKIRAVMDEYRINGEIHDIEFRNFEYARNKALELAKASSGVFNYILFDDADMILEVEEENWKDNLSHDCYQVAQYNQMFYYNVRLVKKTSTSKYRGVTHEYLDCSGSKGIINPKALKYHDLACGSSRKEKFQRDARLLLEGVEKEPDEDLVTRYYFYLGQTYFDMGDIKNGIKYYGERVNRGGWQEEVYYSMYKIGMGHKTLGDEVSMLHSFIQAYNYYPSRIEPIYELSSYYREKGMYYSGYMFARMACNINFPIEDKLFVGKDVYDFKRWDELSICAYWVGNYQESKEVSNFLLEQNKVPEEHLQRVKENLKFAEEKCNK